MSEAVYTRCALCRGTRYIVKIGSCGPLAERMIDANVQYREPCPDCGGEGFVPVARPDREALRERIAEAAFDASTFTASEWGLWIDESRLPEGETVDDWDGEPMVWVYADDAARDVGYRMADAVLAVLAPETEGGT